MRVPVAWLELTEDGLFEVRRLRGGEEVRRVLVHGNGFDLRGDVAAQVKQLDRERLAVSRKAARWALRVLRDASD